MFVTHFVKNCEDESVRLSALLMTIASKLNDCFLHHPLDAWHPAGKLCLSFLNKALGVIR